jgi:AcrR family transcriptional regulator
LKAGRSPSLEEVAAEAKVSRATAYRYFPNMEALLVEVRIDVDMPTPEALFESVETQDVAARLTRVAQAIDRILRDHQDEMRLMLALSLRQPRDADGPQTPVRQNRRQPLIEKALEPARAHMDPATFRKLSAALAVFMGMEADIVFKDVLQLSDNEAATVKTWARAALLQAALAAGRA